MLEWDLPSGATFGRRYPRLATAGWVLAGLCGLLWLLVLSLVVVGLVLGGPGPDAAPPGVDFDESPEKVVADATEQLGYHDFTVEHWFRRTDHKSGRVTGGIRYRFHFELSRGQLRGKIWPARGVSNGTTRPDQPSHEVFVVPGAAWVTPQERDYWQRTSARFPQGTPRVVGIPPERIGRANLTVVTNNETTFVATGGPEAVSTLGLGRNGTVRFVVTKEQDPHLVKWRYRNEERLESYTRVIRILNYGEATAPRPEDVPWTTVDELGVRAIRGLTDLL